MYQNSNIKHQTFEASRSNSFVEQDDFTLWQDFKAGSKQSFSVIYYRYFNDLFNYGLKICSDENLSKDCIQELFANLWARRSNLADVKSIKFYLLTSYRRSVIDKLKKFTEESISKKAFTRAQPSILFSSEEFVVAEETCQIQKEQLAKVLNTLPKRRREAVYLRFYREMTYPEIASLMNLTEKAVINHIYKAFKAIRENTPVMEALEVIARVVIILFGTSIFTL